jgi:hypothetical protein
VLVAESSIGIGAVRPFGIEFPLGRVVVGCAGQTFTAGTRGRDVGRSAVGGTGREQNWTKSSYGQKKQGYRFHVFSFQRYVRYRYETNGCFIATRMNDVEVSVELAVKPCERDGPGKHKLGSDQAAQSTQ